MRRALAILLLPCCLPAFGAEPPFTTGQRIVIIGDSYTQPPDGRWADYVRSFLALYNPGVRLHIQEVARSGGQHPDYFTGTGDRYGKWVYPLEPDYVWIYTFSNGGISKATYKSRQQTLINDYLSLNSAVPYLFAMAPDAKPNNGTNSTFNEYADGDEEIAIAGSYTYVHLFDALVSTYTSATTITADASTDTITSTSHGLVNGDWVAFEISGSPAGPGGLSNSSFYYVRDVSGNTFKVSSTLNGSAVDITSNGSGTSYVSKYWAPLRKAPTDYHPTPTKEIITAKNIITGLGWPTAVAAVTVNGSGYTLTSQTNATTQDIASNAQGGVNFDITWGKLEWAIDEAGRAYAESLVPSMVGWQTRTLTVTGLPAGNYHIYENGVLLGTKTQAELAAGVNMALFTTGPVADQKEEVLGRIRDMQGIDRSTLAEITSPARQGVAKFKSNAGAAYDMGTTGAALISAMSSQIAEIASYDDLIYDAAQPVEYSYSLQREGGPASQINATTGTATTLNHPAP